MARFIGARGRGPWAGANRCQIDSVLPQMLGFVPARKMRARAWIAANLVGWLGERGARAVARTLHTQHSSKACGFGCALQAKSAHLNLNVDSGCSSLTDGPRSS
jgi:hypothetical protein